MCNVGNNETSKKNPVPWLRDIKRRCQAKSKRTGKQCGNWAMKGKRVCRNHGGLSTGPKTETGRENIQLAQLETGEHLTGDLKKKYIRKVLFKAFTDAELLEILPGYIAMRIANMRSPEFRRVRKALTAYRKSGLSPAQLIEQLDGKRPKVDEAGIEDKIETITSQYFKE